MTALECRVLPGLNTPVSAIGAGCWTIGGPTTNNGVPIGWDDVGPGAAFAGLVRALELGITLFDTADVYGLGRSERLIGRLLREVDRSSVVISSKVGYFAGTAAHAYEPGQIRRQFATTLDNLGTDHLDLYFLHSSDFGDDDRYLPGAIEVVRELRDQGLIGGIGMRAPHVFAEEWADSDRPQAAEITRWLGLFRAVRPDVVTARYNLLSPLYATQETDIFTFARRHHVGVLIKQALGQGLLMRSSTGLLRTFSSGDHRRTDPMFTLPNRQRLAARMAALHGRFGHNPAALSRLCLRYALQHAPDAAVLVGFRDPAQLDTAVTSLGDPLTDEEITEIRALLHPTIATGDHTEGTAAHAIHRG